MVFLFFSFGSFFPLCAASGAVPALVFAGDELPVFAPGADVPRLAPRPQELGAGGVPVYSQQPHWRVLGSTTFVVSFFPHFATVGSLMWLLVPPLPLVLRAAGRGWSCRLELLSE